jgi:hypothetical protein
MTYQVKKTVSKFAFQMRPAALHRGGGDGAAAGGRHGGDARRGGALHVEFI